MSSPTGRLECGYDGACSYRLRTHYTAPQTVAGHSLRGGVACILCTCFTIRKYSSNSSFKRYAHLRSSSRASTSDATGSFTRCASKAYLSRASQRRWASRAATSIRSCAATSEPSVPCEGKSHCGTAGGYTNHQCRGELCRVAWHNYTLGRRSRDREHAVPEPALPLVEPEREAPMPSQGDVMRAMARARQALAEGRTPENDSNLMRSGRVG